MTGTAVLAYTVGEASRLAFKAFMNLKNLLRHKKSPWLCEAFEENNHEPQRKERKYEQKRVYAL